MQINQKTAKRDQKIARHHKWAETIDKQIRSRYRKTWALGWGIVEKYIKVATAGAGD